MPTKSESELRGSRPPLRHSIRRWRQRCARASTARPSLPGSLGRIEDLAVQLGMIAYPADPPSGKAVLLVFAGDHGLTEEGVSQYPSAVTVAMVKTYLAGRASANAFAAASDVEIRVVDAGVAAELPVHPNLIDAKIRMGTGNAAREPAMSIQQARRRIGKRLCARNRRDRRGRRHHRTRRNGHRQYRLLRALVHRLAPAPLDDCIGLGAGQDDAGMARKRAAIAKAAARSDASCAARCPQRIRRARNRHDGGRGLRRGLAAATGTHRRIYLQCGRVARDPALSGGAGLLRVRASLR